MKKWLIVLMVFLVIILSLCQVEAQVRCLATKTVNDWNVITANEVAKWFVESRNENIDDFFRYEFYAETEELALVFVRYEMEKEVVVQEIILRKEIREAKKCYDVLFCGDRMMFLEYSENYGYGYDEVTKLYMVQDTY